jgi:signal peptidase I
MNDQTSKKNESIREPWLAIAMSSLLPGAGQYYISKSLTAFFWSLSFAISFIVGIYAMVSRTGNPILAWNALWLGMVIYFWNMVHIFISAKGKDEIRNLPADVSEADPYLAIFLNQWIPGIGQAYIRHWGESLFFFFIFLFGLVLEYFRLFSFGRYVLTVAAMSHVLWRCWKNKKLSRLFAVLYIFVFAMITMTGSYINDQKYIWVSKHEHSLNEPTIHDGDFTLQIIPSLAPIHYGDFIAYTPPTPEGETPYTFAGRAVAFEQDTVLIRDGYLYVNGQRRIYGDIKYAGGEMVKYAVENAYIVEKNSIFVLADNSEESVDSRHLGAIPLEKVKGVSLKIIWPYDRASVLK